MYQGTKHLKHHLDSLCSQNQPSQPPWPDLQGSLCSGSFCFGLLVQVFPAEIFLSARTMWCLPLSKYSISISSLFLHTSFNTLPSPRHSIPLTLPPLPHLPIELGPSEPPSCKTPVPKAKKKKKKKREGGKSQVKPQPLLCNSGQIT